MYYQAADYGELRADGLFYKLIEIQGETIEKHREECLKIPGYRLARIKTQATVEVLAKLEQGMEIEISK